MMIFYDCYFTIFICHWFSKQKSICSPSAIRPRGRPRIQKKPIYTRQVKKFSQKTGREKQAIQSRWIFGQSIIPSEACIENLLPVDEWPSQIVDDSADFSVFLRKLPPFVQEYVESRFSLVKLDRCHKCGGTSGHGKESIIDWMQCDACLNWYHNRCLKISCIPTDFFCSLCK